MLARSWRGESDICWSTPPRDVQERDGVRLLAALATHSGCLRCIWAEGRSVAALVKRMSALLPGCGSSREMVRHALASLRNLPIGFGCRYPMKCPVALLAVYAMLIANVGFGTEVTLAERLFIKVDGITVYYNQQDEVFARKFAERLPQLAREAQEDLRLKRRNPATLAVKTFKARRDKYLAVIAYYLGLKKPTAHMKRTFDVTLASVEETTAATLADCERNGLIDVVQIWEKPDLLATLRANGPDEFFDVDKDNNFVIKRGITFAVSTHLSAVGAGSGKRQTASVIAPLRFGAPNRKKIFLPVVLAVTEATEPEKEVPLQVSAARKYLAERTDTLVDVTQNMLLLGVLHEVTEVAVIDDLIASKDRRWFCEGMANFIACRAVLELDTPEAARRCYDLRQQLDQWQKFEREVNLPGWKVNEDLNAEEQDSDFNRARYAYATKAIANVYEKHGREFFPRWCREIALTPWKKADIATVHAAFERLTGEKLSDYYPRPLF